MLTASPKRMHGAFDMQLPQHQQTLHSFMTDSALRAVPICVARFAVAFAHFVQAVVFEAG